MRIFRPLKVPAPALFTRRMAQARQVSSWLKHRLEILETRVPGGNDAVLRCSRCALSARIGHGVPLSVLERFHCDGQPVTYDEAAYLLQKGRVKRFRVYHNLELHAEASGYVLQVGDTRLVHIDAQDNYTIHRPPTSRPDLFNLIRATTPARGIHGTGGWEMTGYGNSDIIKMDALGDPR